MGTVSAAEAAKFGAFAERWWDPEGPMRPLHRMNPLRTGWIAERVAAAGLAWAGLRLLDVGCGAGLAAEAFARRGASVTAIDASAEAIAAARLHAEQGGLAIDYRIAAPEDLAAEGARFDVVVALEVIEHVADRDAFLAALAALTRPGGRVFLSTLNRTARSFLLAKLGAEYLLRLLPVGTHDWRGFVTPAELARALRRAGLAVIDSAGMTMDPLTGAWRESRDLSVNYLIAARRG
ncbi:bifunctional 2-polyprenyl-6-hydroxyphenol methylase/3-demethylubiquinol 3-O-methyltransferase UbiG [Elioraea tepidiphila]|jgi:2-polyprenyl-6-hydroxyphenyl methylase/3-demethylubiquinone-9 3-methyltransferase|uniref:bifunctional 2-polyprenyl-6-hydroxyphenol methylase/3-demethylubiquinol 3-O-methyltransferase UbiG n=1 Tax=Elioraea tepidiphila TaxID=457934 RepID=UPI00036B1D9D|nr:bifunctional 2-polyprenyl-6-hydroxyphenol methylase/3-demethylubiquinol 3-O-methyltransferase UbiG [Elioraea tepidiphila]